MSNYEEEYEYEDDYGQEGDGKESSAAKTLKGYKVVIALM